TGRVSPREGSVLRNRLAGLLRRREPGLLRKSARRLAEGLRPGRRIGTRHECSPSTRTSETIDDPGGQPAPVGTGANQPGGLRWRPPTPRCESEHHHWPYPGGGGNPGCCGWPGCGCGYPACCCGYPGWPYPAWGAPGWSSVRTTTVCMILSAQVCRFSSHMGAKNRTQQAGLSSALHSSRRNALPKPTGCPVCSRTVLILTNFRPVV